MADIQKSFDQTLVQTSLPDVGMDMAEISIDTIFDNEVVKNIPVVKTFVGLAQAGLNIHDRLFLKKILAFLNGVKQVDQREREEIIAKINGSKKYRLKVGEKLLYIIDACEDYEGSERLAMLFTAFLYSDISYEDYIEASGIVARIANNELQDFLQAYSPGYLHGDVTHLMHTGLLSVDFEEVSVDVEKHSREDWDDSESYNADVSGGELLISATKAGETVFKVFGSKEKKQRLAARKLKFEEERKKIQEKLEM